VRDATADDTQITDTREPGSACSESRYFATPRFC